MTVRKISSFMIAFGLLLWSLAGIFVPVYAEDSADSSLELVCIFDEDETVLSGMEWNIFYAGKRNGDSFAPDGDFSDYKVSFKDTSANSLSDIASTLETYAVIDKIKPFQTAVADDNGIAEFSGLKKGLYLVCGKKLKINYTTYVPMPFVVEIGEQENYTVYPKLFKYGVLDEKDSDYTVRKIWRNSANQPPDENTEITVELYKDGEYDSTVTLNKENDWSYTWTATAHDDWKVKEVDVPKDYTVIYRSNETQYVIVNTHKDFDDSEQPPATETSTTSTNSSLTETTTVSSLKTEDSDLPETSTSSSGKLPQTGQLWWPVPLLAGGGILFIAIGLRIRSRKENEK